MHSGFHENSSNPNNINKGQDLVEYYFTKKLVNPSILIKKNNIKNPLSLIDSDFSLGKLNKPFIPNQLPITISPELLVINFSLMKNFPKFIKPIMYTWNDVTDENQQAFNASLFKYFKNTFSKITSNMVFISLSSLHNIQVETISKLRADFSTGRIIFHHIGYGFPQLTADSIYLSGNIQISPKLLFILLTPPTLYIFDCDNAGSILPVFESIALSRSVQNWQDDSNRQSQKKFNDQRNFSPFQCLSNSVNWSDYFVLCATSPGEELPRDPNLPRDFFTSVLFSPVQTAFLCQVYLSYRTTVTLNDIPQTTVKELEDLLDVIVDGIVCECLPGPNLHTLFRTDKVIHALFRNFVLAQYVLKPFGVHPVSCPALPDMSSNQLWEQWKAAVDNAVGIFATTRSPTRDYFDRALTSFNYLYAKNAYECISPSLIAALLRSENYEGPARLLIDFPQSIEVVANIIVISDLFNCLLSCNPCSEKFKSACMIAVYMLRHDMNFTYQISQDLSWKPFVDAIFDDKVEFETRVLATSILAACVPHHKSLRALCTTQEFVGRIQEEICNVESPPFFVKWLLLLFKRTYDVFSADKDVFIPTGFHTQCAVCALHYSQEVRATAVSCLSCFMQGDDPVLNLRLLLAAMLTFTDVSYLVRHQLLMLVLRYLTTHHDLIDTNQQLTTFDYSSFRSLANSFFKIPDIDHFFDIFGSQFPKNIIEIYKSIEEETDNGKSNHFIALSPQKVNELMQFAITFFAYDPHPAIAAEAASAREFFFRGGRKTDHNNSNSNNNSSSPTANDLGEEEDDSESDSLICIPFESDSDALFQISIRQMLDNVTKGGEKRIRNCFPSDNWSKQSGISLKVECPLSGRPSAICFDSLSTGVIIAGDNDVTYFDDNLRISSSIHISSSFTTDLKSGSWFNESLTLISCGNGCVYAFKIGDDSKKPVACFRADPNIMAASIPLYSSPANDKPRFATVRGTNNGVLWDIETLRIIQEIPPSKNLPFLNLMPHQQQTSQVPVQLTSAVKPSSPLSAPLSFYMSSSTSSSPHLDFEIRTCNVVENYEASNSQPLFKTSFADTNYLSSLPPTFTAMPPSPNATSIAVHPSNSNLLMVGYENSYATITDLRTNEIVDTFCISGTDDLSPVIKVSGNVDGNSTFYAVSRNGSCMKWSPTTSPFTSSMKRKFSMPSIRTGITNLMATQDTDNQVQPDSPLEPAPKARFAEKIEPQPIEKGFEKKATQNSRRISLFAASTTKDKPSSPRPNLSDTKQGLANVCSNIITMNGIEIHDFDAHQILPVIAFSPESLNDQFVLNESTGRVQKVKMDPGSRCVFHPTQPMCALASGRKLKIFRL